MVQGGLSDRICPQALTDCLSISKQFVPRYSQGESEFNIPSFNLSKKISSLDPRETEDFLFVDISILKVICDNARNGCGLLVLAWIHGGGIFVFGKYIPLG